MREHMLLAHAEVRGSQWVREGTLRETFCAAGGTPTQVRAELMALIDRPDAEAEYPVLVHRLRRLRDARQHHRSTRRLAS